VFHTDELPAYGVTSEEVAALREAVDAGDDDAVVLVADEPETAATAIDNVVDRARTAIEGVPEETRGANDDGTTRYLRPLPGAARLYPETDVPPVEPDVAEVAVPEVLDEKVDRYVDDHGLDPDLAEQVAFGRQWPLFEETVAGGVDPTLAATTLASTLTELDRDGVPVDALDDDAIRGTLELVASDDLAREGIEETLTTLAEQPGLSPSEAVEEAGLTGVDEAAVREAVAEVVERNADQVADEGMGAFSGLMGEAMGALRGKADGDLVSDVLREEIQKRA
jgi:glutamyl-tRNA(Gln) amidotransferase subunit E